MPHEDFRTREQSEQPKGSIMTDTVALPTVGRIVNFFPPTPDDSTGPAGVVVYASIVTKINDDLTLELTVFVPNGFSFQHRVPRFGEKVAATAEHPEFSWAWGWSWPGRT
jgi:hypothetical protein